MKNMLKTLSGSILLIALLLGTVSIVSNFAQASNYPITGQNFYLSGAGVTSSQTTVPLTALKTPDGRVITMAMIGTTGYGTLEPQSPAKTELITFTGITQNGNGTATLTGVTRGIDFAYPYAASTAYRQAHAGGATFIISNTPNWYYDNFPIQGDDNLNTWPVASTSVASRGYVDYVAFNGASVINATNLAKGVSQLATGLQAASSTALGSSGAALALTSAISTSTYNAATAALKVVVTGNDGTIDSGFLPATSTKAMAFATSTTIGSTYAFDIGKHEQVFTASSTFNIPNGIRTIFARIVGAGGVGGSVSNCSAAGGAGGYAEKMIDVSATSTINIIVGAASNTTATTTTSVMYPLLQASAGGAGGNASSGNAAGGGGGGGVGIGGTLNSNGQSGASCLSPATGSWNAASATNSLLGSYGQGGGSSSGVGTAGAAILTW